MASTTTERPTVTVQAGDEFGFRISGSNYDTTNILQGTLKVGLNTVVNGGFEQLPVLNTASYDTVPAGSAQLAPWAVSSGSVDHIGQYWTAAEGVQSLDLDGSAPGAIRQAVPTVAGHTYRVAFSYSANPDRTSATPGMTVKADGATLDTFTHRLRLHPANHHLGSRRGELHGPGVHHRARVRVDERQRRLRDRHR